ncbi:MAG: pyridoxal phosphate-dependent aminotransferase [Ruminococcaceae bacterium]|nr:pyridoxal phosphate-dependent aminotransferase [Oscillospiraceae bacterium]
MSYNEEMYALGAKRSVIREIFEYSKKRAAEIGAQNVFDFSLGNPSVEPPAAISDTVMALVQKEGIHGYTSAQGDPTVRARIADHIRARHGVPITPDLIYMTCGAAASLAITLRALLHKGEECVVFAPFFTEYRVFVENAGGTLTVCAPLEKTFQVDVADLAKKLTPNTKAVILNSPNNPSGVVYSTDTVRGICDVLRQKSAEFGHPIYLIADEPYRELVYGEVEVPYLMKEYAHTVVCYSYSKSLSLPGERIGYIAVCPDMPDANDLYLAICGAGRSLGYVCAPALFQHLIAAHVDTTVDISHYRENRDLLLQALTSYGYECVRPDGAFYLFVKALESDANAFCERARAHELLLVPCDDFGVTGYVRIAYCVDRSRIERALPAFRALADEYRR